MHPLALNPPFLNRAVEPKLFDRADRAVESGAKRGSIARRNIKSSSSSTDFRLRPEDPIDHSAFPATGTDGLQIPGWRKPDSNRWSHFGVSTTAAPVRCRRPPASELH